LLIPVRVFGRAAQEDYNAMVSEVDLPFIVMDSPLSSTSSFWTCISSLRERRQGFGVFVWCK
jgi:hypothetical protein